MSPEERMNWQIIWNAICSIVALYYLGVGTWVSVVIGIFILVSSALDYGRRWLMMAGFGLSAFVLLIVVAPSLIENVSTLTSRLASPDFLINLCNAK